MIGEWKTGLQLVSVDVNKSNIAVISKYGKKRLKLVKWDGFNGYIVHKGERYYLRDCK